MTNNLQAELDLKSAMIMDMIESFPETQGAITDDGVTHVAWYEEQTTLTGTNHKFALAMAYGAVTTRCEQYQQMDAIIKNQLYSRDMAGYTTSYVEKAVRLPDYGKIAGYLPAMVGQTSSVSQKDYDDYQKDWDKFKRNLAYRKLAQFAQREGGPSAEFLKNLFHEKVEIKS